MTLPEVLISALLFMVCLVVLLVVISKANGEDL